MVYKPGIIFSLIILLLVPIGSKFEEMFRTEWFGVAGIALMLGAFFSGMAGLALSLNLPSPLCFLHNKDEEIIERLDKIEGMIKR